MKTTVPLGYMLLADIDCMAQRSISGYKCVIDT